MADQVKIRAFSITVRDPAGPDQSLSFVEEFDREPPQEVKDQMALIAQKTSESTPVKMEVRFDGRMMEKKWSGGNRDGAILYAVTELLMHAKDPLGILRAVMPRGPAKLAPVAGGQK